MRGTKTTVIRITRGITPEGVSMCKRMKGLLEQAGLTQEQVLEYVGRCSISSGKDYVFINGCKTNRERTMLYDLLSKSPLGNTFSFQCGHYLTFKRKDKPVVEPKVKKAKVRVRGTGVKVLNAASEWLGKLAKKVS